MPTLLCTLDRLKALLGVAADETVDDAKLTVFIELASAQIESTCRRKFAIVDIAGELHDGDETDSLLVDITPIVDVSALAIDGAPVDVAELAIYPVMVAFRKADGWDPRLRSYARLFPAGRQNISISYRAGYAAVPDDVAGACAIQAMFVQNTLAKQGVVSETNSVSQATTAYAQDELAPPVRAVCARYRPRRLRAV